MHSRSEAVLRTPRLYVPSPLGVSARITLSDKQAHYLVHVLRLGKGATFRLFNGRDGEWLAQIVSVGKKDVTLTCEKLLRQPTSPPDIDYLFAPLKHARIDYMAQKATELGVRRLLPVITRHTNVERVNTERLRANVIEAAEQCNLVSIPEVLEPVALDKLLTDWDERRRLIYCDEGAPQKSPLLSLGTLAAGPLALLIGPEGGFAAEEQKQLRGLSFVTTISLGPRIMRADTAAVAALGLIQAVLGDWRQAPSP